MQTPRRPDVRSGEAVAGVIRDVGPIDVLFSCAAFVHHGGVLDWSDMDCNAAFDTAGVSPAQMRRPVAPAGAG